MSIKAKFQSILFPKDISKEEREKFLTENGFKLKFRNKEAEETDNYFRYRQKNPKSKENEEYRTIVIDPKKGIKAIYDIT